jgi:acyl carrier protein
VTAEDALGAKVCEVVARLAPVSVAEATGPDRLVEDLGYHSLALLELAIELEDLFGLPPLEEQTAFGIETVADVVGLIDRLVRDAAGG